MFITGTTMMPGQYTRQLAQNKNSAPAAEGKPAPAEAKPPAGNNKVEPGPAPLEQVLDSKTLTGLAGNLKSGDRIVISSNGQPVLEIKKQSESTLGNLMKASGDFMVRAGEEVSNVIAQDPAFAFKESALAVRERVFNGVPEGLREIAVNSFLPMIRVVALVLDGKKCYDTFKENREPATKVVDTLHVVTDVVGLAGAILMAFPGQAGLATTLTVIGVLGDIAAYGYHVTEYIQRRGAPDGSGEPIPPDPPPQPAPQPQPQPQPAPSSKPSA